jgi:hypothetical protein
VLMELVGEEKRIQALFSDARLADEQITPSFAGVWNRAQAKTARPQRAFNLSFVTATALLVCALVSLAWWVNRSQPGREALVASVPAITDGGTKNIVQAVAPRVSESTVPPVAPRRSNERSRALKSAARQQAVLVAANQQAVRDAKAIEDWQSPTATLLDSSSDALLKSVPQLNKTVDDLKSFLPSQPK